METVSYSLLFMFSPYNYKVGGAGLKEAITGDFAEADLICLNRLEHCLELIPRHIIIILNLQSGR